MPDQIEIALADLDAWEAFALANDEALTMEFGSTCAALHAACYGGLHMGGGEAPFVSVCFADILHSNPEKAALAREYVECIGYDPFADDGALTAAEVRQTLREWREDNARNP